jgi:hypothetical protein
MNFKSHGLKIVLPPKALIEVGEAALETIKEQCNEGVTATGAQTEIDWRRSGDLLDTAGVTDEGALVFPVPYAEVVNNRHPFLGIAPQYQQVYDDKLSPILQENLEFEKEV